jgi:vacuolar-type H+-ATPase subunit D/Vma8
VSAVTIPAEVSEATGKLAVKEVAKVKFKVAVFAVDVNEIAGVYHPGIVPLLPII